MVLLVTRVIFRERVRERFYWRYPIIQAIPKMNEYPLVAAKGRMSDSQFCDCKTCLVTAINATSYNASGIAKDLAETYTYANLFGDRKRLFNLNRAIWCDRPSVSTLVVREPPPRSKYPYVVGLVTQFGPGESVEYNSTAKYCIDNSKDVHYVNGLTVDTKENRRESFKECLKNLADFVLRNRTISRVVIPRGIGRRGKMDHEWRSKYLIPLRDLAYKLDLNNIEVLLLEQEVKDVGEGSGGCVANAPTDTITDNVIETAAASVKPAL